MNTAYQVLAIITILVWLPSIYRFFQSWKDRRNPISLAICSSCLFAIWSTASWCWVFKGVIGSDVLAVISISISCALGVFFLLASIWSDKRFTGERTKDAARQKLPLKPPG